MYGVSKINIEPSLMMISVQDVEFKGNSLARYLQIFADTGVVVDMISQSAPHGTTMDFSFTASASDLPLVMKAISAANLDKDAKASPLISVGYSKLNLFGEEMVTSCGVAARALNALAMADIEVLLITTSDLDISLLVRAGKRRCCLRCAEEGIRAVKKPDRSRNISTRATRAARFSVLRSGRLLLLWVVCCVLQKRFTA